MRRRRRLRVSPGGAPSRGDADTDPNASAYADPNTRAYADADPDPDTCANPDAHADSAANGRPYQRA